MNKFLRFVERSNKLLAALVIAFVVALALSVASVLAATNTSARFQASIEGAPAPTPAPDPVGTWDVPHCTFETGFANGGTVTGCTQTPSGAPSGTYANVARSSIPLLHAGFNASAVNDRDICLQPVSDSNPADGVTPSSPDEGVPIAPGDGLTIDLMFDLSGTSYGASIDASVPLNFAGC